MSLWKILHKIIGVLLIILGLTSYVFPAPGSTLLVSIGFVWLMGKDRTLYFLREILGKKIFKSLKIKSIVRKV